MQARRRVILVLLCLAVATVPLIASANDEFEPNDDFNTATEIDPGTYSGLELVGEEDDYYRLSAGDGDTLEEGDTLQIVMEVPDASDGGQPDNSPDLYLKDSEGNTIAFDEERSVPVESSHKYVIYYEVQEGDLSKGNHLYVRARSLSDDDATADYSLDIRRNDNDRNEPNSDISTATSIEPGTYTGLTLLDDESDYYAVEADAGETLNVTMTVPKAPDGDSPDNRPFLYLRDATGDRLDFGDERTTNVRDTTRHVIKYEVEADGTYYLHASGLSDETVKTEYTLNVDRAENDRFEPNGNVDTATPLEPGTYDNLTLLDDENDYYEIEVDPADTLSVNMTVPKAPDGEEPDNDPWLDIVDGDGNDLDTGVRRTTDTRDSISRILKYEVSSSGPLYLRVEGLSDSEVETDYSLSVARNDNDRYEPNGNISTATPLDPGTYDNLTLLDDENDYYEIEADPADTLAATMTVPKVDDGDESDNDPNLELLDSNGDYIDDGDYRTTDTRDNISYVLKHEVSSSSPLYLRAFGHDDREVETDYTLSVARNDNDRYEPNGNISTATPLDPGTYDNLTLLDDENDYYEINSTAGGTLNVTMTVPKADDGDESDNGPELELLDADGDFLDEGNYRTTEAADHVDYRLMYETESTEPVYLRAYGRDDREVETGYTLSLAQDDNDRYEPNGNLDTATPLRDGTYDDLTLLDEESDYYAVTVADGGTLNATAEVRKADDGNEPDNDPDLELVDSDGEFLASDSTDTAPARETVTHTLEYTAEGEQTVYVRSHGSDAEAVARYTLAFDGDISKPTAQKNEPPTANPVSISTNENTSVSDSFDATDPDGDSLSYEVDAPAVHGTVTISDGTFTYEPEAGYSGADSFWYTVSDGNDGTDTAKVEISVESSTPEGPDDGVGDVNGDGQRATDVDGDGTYEDVNGDGVFDITDVSALFQNRGAPVVTDNAAQFDFNGDGAFDITDVSALFQMALN